MKKTRLFYLLSASLLSGLILTGCKNKESSSSGGNSSEQSSEGGETTPNYEVTEAEFLVAKSKVDSPRGLFEGNYEMSFNGATYKVDNGKAEFITESIHNIFEFNVSTYNTSTLEIIADEYNFDTDTWYLDEDKTIYLESLYFYSGLYMLDALPETYGELTYSEESHSYSAIVTYEEMTMRIIMSFENTNFKTVTFDFPEAEVPGTSVGFTGWGTTSVVLPTEFTPSV